MKRISAIFMVAAMLILCSCGSNATGQDSKSADDNGQTEVRHTVTVSDFYMSAYELTQAEYQDQERILENLGSCKIQFTDEEFRALERGLDDCTVHGHRGHIESEQSAFGNQWKNKTGN